MRKWGNSMTRYLNNIYVGEGRNGMGLNLELVKKQQPLVLSGEGGCVPIFCD